MRVTDQAAFDQRVLGYLEDTERKRAVESLDVYTQTFSGRAFERLADPDPFSITARDIIAVSTLSVQIPGEAAIWILGEGALTISALLRRIPPGVAITDEVPPLQADDAASQLWNLLRQLHEVGPTKVSKLLAAKRPALIPIHDRHVLEALSFNGEWELWTGLLHGPNGDAVLAAVDAIASDAGCSLAPLRVIDIAVWMRAWGHQYAGQLLSTYSADTPVGA